jgi:catecholate siderophore receptor
MWSGDSVETALVGQFDVIVDLSTGALAHTLVAGVELGRETSTPNFFNSLGVPNVNLSNPGPLQRFTSANTFLRVAADTTAHTVSFYGVDTISFGEHWDLAGGFRWDRFAADFGSRAFDPNGNQTGSARFERVDVMPSWRGALVYKPVPEASVYLAYGTSFNPSAEGLSFIVAGRNLGGVGNIDLEPEENQTYEGGAKWEVLDRRLVLTAAAFRIEKLNARVPDPNNPGFNMLGGRHRVDGAQVQATGYLRDGWYVNLGYTFLDSKVVESAAGAAPVGRPLVNTPEHSFTFFTEYRLFENLDVGFGGRYQSERLGQNTGATPLVAPGFWSFDGVLRYTIGEHMIAQLNVYNVGDSYYIEQLHPFHIVPAAGRSALFTVKMQY